MIKLSKLLEESSTGAIRVVKLFAGVLICIYICLSLWQIQTKKQEVHSYITNIFDNNLSLASEEERFIYMVKSFSNIFTISISEKDKVGSLCGPKNCYELNFFKLYLNFFLELIFLFLVVLVMSLLTRVLRKREFSVLAKEVQSLESLLGGADIRDKKLITNELNRIWKIVKERESNLAYIHNAKSIAHDIQSPLAALSVVMDDLETLPEMARELTMHAINRIQDIADELSEHGEVKEVKESNCLPSVLLHNTLNEKIIEYGHCEDLQVKFIDNTKGSELVKMVRSDFSRIVSNLVNNSIESMDHFGSIKVEANTVKDQYQIIIQDNGGGFPASILNKPITRGQSIGKESGKGLGLYHAKKLIDAWGGKMSLSNNSGALISLSLPISR
jgi:signal transduction histidine kinase